MAVLMADVPSHERPRERLLARGVEALTDRELVALVLRNGARGVSALDLAAGLIAEYGSLARLASARPEELAQRRGIGPAKAAAILAAFCLAHRSGAAADASLIIRSADDVASVAQRELQGLRRERVLVLVCDGANRLRQSIVVSEGSIDRSMVPVREVLNAVLRHDGRAFALAHNHPSGDASPSDADRRSTRDIAAAAKVAGLRFLGHVVVGSGQWSLVT
jgi:DNA repair protein RadC